MCLIMGEKQVGCRNQARSQDVELLQRAHWLPRDHVRYQYRESEVYQKQILKQ